MKPPLPSTPAEVLHITSASSRLIIPVVTGLAERLGFWRTPLRNAAAASEEMGPLDSLYWIHKSKNPVARPEPAPPPGGEMNRDPGTVRLPEGFEPAASVTIGAAGDLLRVWDIEESVGILFEGVADLLFDQDISMANLESPVTTQPLMEEVIGDTGPSIECCAPRHFEVMTRHGDRSFTLLHTANNHIFDLGLKGLETTLAAMDAAGIADLGTNRTPSSYGRGMVLERNGIRIGFAAAGFGLNGHALPEEERYRIHVAPLVPKGRAPDLTLLRRQIDDCREQGCDFVIASLHWGYEFEFFPRNAQIAAARELTEYGADAIISHHPHVIQPVEFYRTRRDPDRIAVIAYSLGTLTWGFMAPHVALSLILNLKLAKGTWQGETRTYVEKVRLTPVLRNCTAVNGKVETRLEKLSAHPAPGGSPLPAGQAERAAEYAGLVLGPGWVREGPAAR